jgi:hypothetical protein
MATQLRAGEHQTQGRAYSCLPRRLTNRAHSSASPRGMHQDAAQSNESEVVGATMPQLEHEYSPAPTARTFPRCSCLPRSARPRGLHQDMAVAHRIRARWCDHATRPSTAGSPSLLCALVRSGAGHAATRPSSCAFCGCRGRPTHRIRGRWRDHMASSALAARQW